MWIIIDWTNNENFGYLLETMRSVETRYLVNTKDTWCPESTFKFCGGKPCLHYNCLILITNGVQNTLNIITEMFRFFGGHNINRTHKLNPIFEN